MAGGSGALSWTQFIQDLVKHGVRQRPVEVQVVLVHVRLAFVDGPLVDDEPRSLLAAGRPHLGEDFIHFQVQRRVRAHEARQVGRS